MTTAATGTPSENLAQARAAAAEHRWADAVAQYQAADGDAPLAPSDLDGLAHAAWWSGDMVLGISVGERAYAAYSAAGDLPQAAAAALSLAGDYRHRLQNAVASGWLRRAQRLLADLPESAHHGYLERALMNEDIERGQLDEALERAERALDIGLRFKETDLTTIALQDKGRVLIAIGRVDEGMGLLEEAVAIAMGDELSSFATAVVYCNATVACEDVADYRRASDFADAAKRWCDRQQITGFPGMCRVRRAEITRLSGDWDQAESEARLATDELRGFALDYAGEGFYQIGEIRRRLGDFGAAEAAFNQAHEFGRDPEPGLALLRLDQGLADAGMALLTEALSDPTATPLTRAHLVPALVEAAVAAGDLARARPAADEMEALATTYGTHALRAAAARSRALVDLAEGRVEAAADAFRQERRLWQELGAPYETARARIGLGEALLAGARTEAAGTEAASLELRSAMSTFERLRAAPDIQRTKSILDRIGGPRGGDAPERKAERVFMFTDVVRSTDLIEAIGDDAWGALLRWHDDTIRHLVVEHRGEILDHAGDGFFLAFADADLAIEAATAIRRTMRDHRRDHGFAPAIRMGLHAAKAMKSGSSYSGRGVHVAARIAALAGPDEIVASEDVLAATERGFAHGPLRAERLKGIRVPVNVAQID